MFAFLTDTWRRGPLRLRLYLALELLAFLAIQYAMEFLTIRPMKNIMFSAIVLNTLAALWVFLRYGCARPANWDNLIALALGVNCVADVFLTFLGGESMYVPGFALFCTVEAVYALYLRPDRKNLAIRAALFAAGVLLAVCLHLLTLANVLGVLNLTLLGMNVYCAWAARRWEGSVPSLVFAAALTLFFAGDISVGVRLFLPEGGTAFVLVEHLVWIFYLPAQILLFLTYRARIAPPANREANVHAL